MLTNSSAIATVAVKNLAAARHFYEDTLGLQAVATEGDEVVTYRSGESRMNVYHSKYAGTNRATAVTWVLGDRLDEEVRLLKERGVAFEHYDMPGLKLDGDVHVGEGMRIAWFKDPDGNIHNLVSG